MRNKEDDEIVILNPETDYEIGQIVAYIPPDAFTGSGRLRKKFEQRPPLAYAPIVDIYIEEEDNQEWFTLEVWDDTEQDVIHLSISWEHIVLPVGRCLYPF